MPRNPKGSVSVETVRGRLRLRLPRHVFRDRRYLSLCLPDTPTNRKVAQAKAAAIESDIALERADLTLRRYKSPYAPTITLSLLTIWDRFAEWKSPQLAVSTVARDFRKTRNHIQRIPIKSLDRAIEIRNWIGSALSPDSARRLLTQIKAATKWASEEGLIESDPFAGLQIRERRPRAKKRRPFSPGERRLILDALEEREPHYAPYVRFLFLTGARTSEANGLQWEDVDLDNAVIIFRRARIEGKLREGLKTEGDRIFPINPQLAELLASLPRRAGEIFRTSNGSPIDAHNFSNKVWKPLVSSLPIPYRPQYTTRHTFISECLAAGVTVATVAEWVGNSAKTIYTNYAGPDINAAPPGFALDEGRG